MTIAILLFVMSSCFGLVVFSLVQLRKGLVIQGILYSVHRILKDSDRQNPAYQRILLDGLKRLFPIDQNQFKESTKALWEDYKKWQIK